MARLVGIVRWDPRCQAAQLLTVFRTDCADVGVIGLPKVGLVRLASETLLYGRVRVGARVAVIREATAVGLGAWAVFLADTMIWLAIGVIARTGEASAAQLDTFSPTTVNTVAHVGCLQEDGYILVQLRQVALREPTAVRDMRTLAGQSICQLLPRGCAGTVICRL